MFNHLEYVFGEDKKCTADPCFAQWLMRKAKNADALRIIDRDKLRRRIMKCHKSIYFVVMKFATRVVTGIVLNVEDVAIGEYGIAMVVINLWILKSTYGASLPCERCGYVNGEFSDYD
ncbi:unnamed protein product [Rotaria magnacalcarata]|uniref:Uncharacterized protein n=1 Tax=Rotaria magnacalcarata TaxID=392030 RepID=A0A819SRT7_9BILA|nr:unnamed protein product [Rotaria magnacalcarata]CAF1589900.1 unnamed protein product [Rotaria magnacalcarata]CAF1944834.1 unnamed protein product [Rotaria magnacalcarata]CAF2106335.1 unnamed protein product [Rotaria magnacalcarata]CAF4066414.1 unnamed protein product [Rotaria magnacalcarata]